MKRFVGATFVLLILLTTAADAQGRERADLVLHNGRIVTLDDADHIVSALVIRGGKIVAVGDESLNSRYDAKRVIDLGGRMAMPGFNDSHIHIAGRGRRETDLSRVRSIKELQDSVAAKVRLLGPGRWIVGEAWAEDNFAERRVPVRGDLDAVAPRNPWSSTARGITAPCTVPRLSVLRESRERRRSRTPG